MTDIVLHVKQVAHARVLKGGQQLLTAPPYLTIDLDLENSDATLDDIVTAMEYGKVTKNGKVVKDMNNG
jgi:hypothetical protein